MCNVFPGFGPPRGAAPTDDLRIKCALGHSQNKTTLDKAAKAGIIKNKEDAAADGGRSDYLLKEVTTRGLGPGVVTSFYY